jgi:hypothetical protein
VPGILQAFDATDVTHELWNSNMSGKRDSVGKFAKFVAPTIANGKVYLATFSNKLNVYGLNPPSASSCPNPLPAPWQSADVGYVTYPGDVCDNGGVYTLTASGDDIWNTADAFHYMYQPVSGNSVEIIARVVSIQNTNTWAKAGVMFRSNLDAGSANVFMAISPGNGATFQNRPSQSSVSTNTSKGGPAAPYWVRILSTGNKYVGYVSTDGTNWIAVDSTTIALGANAYVGIASSAHDNTQLGTSVIDNVSVTVHTILPVDLINFTAKNINNTYAQLNWTTTSDINNDHFDIERSGINSDFTLIGSVKATVSSTSTQQYIFNDLSPLDGTNFYRLKQIDLNGNPTYSNIATATFNLHLIDIFPNPAHKQLYVRNNSNFSNGDNLTIQLSNELGQILYRQSVVSAGGNIITINIPQKTSNGVYVLKVTNSKGQVQARKIYITK